MCIHVSETTQRLLRDAADWHMLACRQIKGRFPTVIKCILLVKKVKLILLLPACSPCHLLLFHRNGLKGMVLSTSQVSNVLCLSLLVYFFDIFTTATSLPSQYILFLTFLDIFRPLYTILASAGKGTMTTYVAKVGAWEEAVATYDHDSSAATSTAISAAPSVSGSGDRASGSSLSLRIHETGACSSPRELQEHYDSSCVLQEGSGPLTQRSAVKDDSTPVYIQSGGSNRKARSESASGRCLNTRFFACDGSMPSGSTQSPGTLEAGWCGAQDDGSRAVREAKLRLRARRNVLRKSVSNLEQYSGRGSGSELDGSMSDMDTYVLGRSTVGLCSLGDMDSTVSDMKMDLRPSLPPSPDAQSPVANDVTQSVSLAIFSSTRTRRPFWRTDADNTLLAPRPDLASSTISKIGDETQSRSSQQHSHSSEAEVFQVRSSVLRSATELQPHLEGDEGLSTGSAAPAFTALASTVAVKAKLLFSEVSAVQQRLTEVLAGIVQLHEEHIVWQAEAKDVARQAEKRERAAEERLASSERRAAMAEADAAMSRARLHEAEKHGATMAAKVNTRCRLLPARYGQAESF